MSPVFALAAALLAAGPTATQPPLPTGKVYVAPDWLKKPTPEDLLGVWPKAAMKSGVGGKAVIHCKVGARGVLYGCEVVSETPEGAGFGQAAIAVTPQLLMKPATLDGVPIEGADVRLPLVFPRFDPPDNPSGDLRTVVTVGRWTEAPSIAQVIAAYPAKAKARKAGGRVVLSCTFREAGRIKYCEAISTEPRDLGFRQAALNLETLFVGPATLDGKSTRGMVTQIVITFAPEMLDSTEPLVGKPQWARTPTAEQMAAALPKDRSMGGTVRVRLACIVGRGGKTEDCSVQSEEPAGKGFGVMALDVSKYFELSVWSRDGLPTVGGRVTIPLRYELGAPAPPPAKP